MLNIFFVGLTSLIILVSFTFADNNVAQKAEIDTTPHSIIEKSEPKVYPHAKSDLSPLKKKERVLSSKEIKIIQKRLHQKGYKTRLTGKTDKQTKKSLMRFQKDKDFETTGSLDSRTLKALGIRL